MTDNNWSDWISGANFNICVIPRNRMAYSFVRAEICFHILTHISFVSLFIIVLFARFILFARTKEKIAARSNVQRVGLIGH